MKDQNIVGIKCVLTVKQLLRTCNKLDGTTRQKLVATRLVQLGYNLDITILLQPCVCHIVVTTGMHQSC